MFSWISFGCPPWFSFQHRSAGADARTEWLKLKGTKVPPGIKARLNEAVNVTAS
jgi:hypothetical protein